MPQYRAAFFYRLKELLLDYDIELNLIYGKSQNSNILRGDEVEIDWANFVANKTITIMGNEFIWQPCLKKIRGASMIIIQPEMKLITNYFLIFFKYFGRFKLGFWGHGRNMQGKPNGFRNKLNNFFLNKCDWWFAYTKGVKEYLIAHHYPENHISIVHNAIDTIDLRENYNSLDELKIDTIKKELGISGGKTAIYCGAMYKEKRIDFIIEAAHRIKSQISDFHLILIGAGIESGKAKKSAEENSWIHYLGPKFGKDRIGYFKISAVQLMPGAVGLGILDSFALETPIITTEYPFHGPEFDYLENGKNGIITKNDLENYASTVADILETNKHLQLAEGCKLSLELYTVGKMVDNFKDGILSCIGYENKAKQSPVGY